MKGNDGANSSAGTLLYWKTFNDIGWQTICYLRLSFQEYSAQSVLLLSFVLTNSLAYIVLCKDLRFTHRCSDVNHPYQQPTQIQLLSPFKEYMPLHFD